MIQQVKLLEQQIHDIHEQHIQNTQVCFTVLFFWLGLTWICEFSRWTNVSTCVLYVKWACNIDWVITLIHVFFVIYEYVAFPRFLFLLCIFFVTCECFILRLVMFFLDLLYFIVLELQHRWNRFYFQPILQLWICTINTLLVVGWRKWDGGKASGTSSWSWWS